MRPPKLDELWAAYLTAERRAVRTAAMAELARLIEEVLRLPDDDRRRWACDLAAAVADRGADLPVRFPLFQQVLLPALAEAVLRGEPGAARRLSHFEQHLLKTRDLSLPSHLRTAHGLLEEAVRVDPLDDDSRRKLVQHLARYLDYTLHELPAGILYGHDGATLEQCDDLLDGLEIFRRHVDTLGENAAQAERIRACEFHYRAYRNYLLTQRVHEGYAQYLNGLAPDPSD